MLDKKLKEINFNDYSHLRVTNNRVMIVELEVDYTKSVSGIQLSASEPKKEFSQGIVVAVGDGYLSTSGDMIKPDFKVGDLVFLSDMAGIEFKVIRGDCEFEKVRIVDTNSIYFVDGACPVELYTGVANDSTQTS